MKPLPGILLAALAASAVAWTASAADVGVPGSIYDRGWERQFDYGSRQLEPDFWELRDRFGQVDQDRFRLGYERGRFDDRLYRHLHDRSGSVDAVERGLRLRDMARRGILDAPAATPPRRPSGDAERDMWRSPAFERFGFGAPGRG